MGIILTRIDNRLVHGQVGAAWVKSIGANLVVVCDDIVSNDIIQQQLMKMTADSLNFDIRFFSIQKTLNVIEKASPTQKILLICRDPKTVRKLVENNLFLEKINIGNMHYTQSKVQISRKVYVNEDDLKDFEEILKKGSKLFIQDVPDESIKKIDEENLWKLI